MSMKSDEITTFQGVPFDDALQKMQEVLPPEAYKAVTGAGADLTDINPAYLSEKVTEIFGGCGVGWFYQIEREDQHVQQVERTRSGGGTYDTWEASVDMLLLFYRFFDGEGNLHVSEAIISNGYSDNKNRGYALRGAITNAIGAGFAKLLWQLPVYKGIVDHKNARLYEVGSIPTAPVSATSPRSGASAKPTASSAASKSTAKPKTAAKTAAKKASEPAAAQPAKPVEAQKPADAPAGDTLKAAQDYVIPDVHIIKKHRGYRMGGPEGEAPGLTPEAIAYYAQNWKPSPEDAVGQTIVKYAGMLVAAV